MSKDINMTKTILPEGHPDASDSVPDHSEFEHSEFKEEGEEEKQQFKIAEREDKYVRRIRWVVIIVLGAAMIGVALAVYFYTRNQEETNFETQFKEEAYKVLESLGVGIDKTLAAVDALTVNIVSYARSTNQTWPFVTVPDFYLRFSKMASISPVLILTVAPLVTPENRLKWEEYAKTHDFWVNESLPLMETDRNFHGPVLYEWEPYHVVHDEYGDVPYNNTNNMFPVWQSGPVVPYYPPYNWDYGSSQDFAEPLARALEGAAVISPALMNPDPNDPDAVEYENYTADWFKDFISPDEPAMEPVSEIIYPVINQVAEVEVEVAELQGDNGTASNVKPVGIVTSSWYWRDLIKNILPTGANGIIVVFHDSCGADFTYQLDGPKTTYVGYGDLHQTKYDYLGIHKQISELGTSSGGQSGYTGIPIAKAYCPFSISIYPSDLKYDQYTTNDPAILTSVAVLIFLFTSIVFVVYDRMVERRQTKVMNSAEKTNAVVESLFPSNVRDRMLDDKSQKKKQKNSFLAEVHKSQQMGLDTAVGQGAPIADLFPETTVYFADIAGFTNWSSERSPVEVFVLLETLYAAMDKLAHKHKIFKVETIGDCYMAVCGLPDPNKRHALAMARFAGEAMEAMKVVTRELVDALGEGTADLDLRAGLHSGPTTAGVLRGEKSRFQLFGDTVNTASRMESTGLSGRIQVSKSTAELLRKAGKDAWLTPRQDKIVAKGKGEMETYWCKPKNVARTGKSQESAPSSQETAHADEEIGGVSMNMSMVGFGEEQKDWILSLTDITEC